MHSDTPQFDKEVFEMLFNEASTFMCLLDLKGNIIDINKSALKATNLNYREALSIPFTAFNWKSAGDIKKNLSDALEKNRVSFEAVLNEKIHFEFIISAVKTNTDSMFFCEGKDITNYINTQFEFDNLKKQNDLILQSAGEGIIGLNTDDEATFINPAAKKLLGWSVKDLVGKHVHPIIHHTKANGQKYDSKDCPIKKSIETDKVIYITDEIFWKKDGTIIPVEYSAAPLHENGKVTGAVIIFNDITQKKEAERKLLETQQQFKLAFENAPIGMAVVNAITHEIHGVNQALCDMLGYTKKELTSLESKTFIHPDDINKDQKAYINLLDGKIQTFSRERRYLHKTGKIVWVYVGISIVRDFENKPIYIIFQAHDITERKKYAEELLKLNTQLERSNGELQDFASVSSHDLQEPLRKVQAFADRLKVKYKDKLDAEGIDYLSRMQNAASRMQTLINDLLSFSRVTTKAQPYIEVDLNKITEDVINDLEIRIEDLNGKVTVKVLPVIEADALQMRQLFQNLIANALKFHKPDIPPVIKIYSQNNSKDRSLAVICVEDNGIGFDEKYLDRIFNIFQRLHTASQYSGTGVGLAVCKKIVERHEGTITATSKIGEGSKFIISMPYVHKKED